MSSKPLRGTNLPWHKATLRHNLHSAMFTVKKTATTKTSPLRCLGSETAQRNAARQYSQGTGGIARDDTLALFWMQLSANQNAAAGLKSRAALPAYQARCTGSCNIQARQMVQSFRVQDACTDSGLTRTSYCNSRGTPTVVDDAVQRVCTCVPDPTPSPLPQP